MHILGYPGVIPLATSIPWTISYNSFESAAENRYEAFKCAVQSVDVASGLVMHILVNYFTYMYYYERDSGTLTT